MPDAKQEAPKPGAPKQEVPKQPDASKPAAPDAPKSATPDAPKQDAPKQNVPEPGQPPARSGEQPSTEREAGRVPAHEPVKPERPEQAKQFTYAPPPDERGDGESAKK